MRGGNFRPFEARFRENRVVRFRPFVLTRAQQRIIDIGRASLDFFGPRRNTFRVISIASRGMIVYVEEPGCQKNFWLRIRASSFKSRSELRSPRKITQSRT